MDKRWIQETRMKIKLNGWQRIGVVLNAIYLIIIIIIAWGSWPTQKRIESSWVYSALNAIVKPGTYAYELREGRFKDISDGELIKRINLEYNANKVKEIMPTIQEVINHPAFKTLPDEEKRRVFSMLSPEYNSLPPEEQDKVIKHYSEFQQTSQIPLSTQEQPEPKPLKLVIDHFIIAQIEGELITLGEKLAQQCQEKLKEVNLRYQQEIESLGIDRLRIIGISLMAWIIPSGIVYLLCLAIGWIYRGFKENKNLVN